MKRLSKHLQEVMEMENFIKVITDGVAILDQNKKFIYVNDKLTQITGYTKEEFINRDFVELSPRKDRDNVESILEKAFFETSLESFNKNCIAKDGRVLVLNVILSKFSDNNSKFIAIIKDITDETIMDKRISEYISIVNDNLISSRTDLKGQITEVSNAFCKISGYEEEELLGENHRIVKHQDTDPKLYKEIWGKLKNDESWKGEIKNRKKDGKAYWVEAYIAPEYDYWGEKKGYISIRHDITDKKQIEEVTMTDELTGIYNRRFFNTIMPRVLNGAKRDNRLICFAMLDIDNFKLYNDTYGHQEGDIALQKVATTIQKYCKRADDYYFRLGGEEFVIVLSMDNKTTAFDHLCKIKDSIEDMKIKHKFNSVSQYMTVSIGMVCINGQNIESLESLYNKADILLYCSKSNGRNCVTFNKDEL